MAAFVAAISESRVLVRSSYISLKCARSCWSTESSASPVEMSAFPCVMQACAVVIAAEAVFLSLFFWVCSPTMRSTSAVLAECVSSYWRRASLSFSMEDCLFSMSVVRIVLSVSITVAPPAWLPLPL